MKELLLSLSQRPIAFFPIYAQITGSVTSGVLLSQLMYWWSVVKGEEFFKTDQDIMKETMLSPAELRTAKARLRETGFVTIKAKGIPAKTHYEIDAEKLCSCITSFVDSAKLVSLNPQNSDSEINKTITENTEENKHDIAGGQVAPPKQLLPDEKVYAPAADKSTLHEQEGVYREGLRRVIRKRIYSRVSKAAKERGMNIDDLIDSFVEYCFASGRKYNEKGTGLAQLFDKHLRFLKVDHVPDHSEYDRIAGIVVNACEKAWLRVSPGHNFPYGYNNMGRMPEAWWEGERAAIVSFLSKKVITSQELNTIYKNLARFNPDAVYSWQQMDRFKIKTYL